jgi:hypothetical protein
MAELARIALELGCEHIGWKVLTWNREAQALYRAIGGAEEQVLSFSLGPRQIKSLARCFSSKH